jgi:hypothetical protein
MYCRKCGTQNDDNNYKCVRCGEALQQVGTSTPPLTIPNYLVQSILVTLFCCLPFGIPAIVYAAQVNGKIQAGDIHGAIDSSKKALMWIWISLGLGIVVGIIYGILMAIGAAAGN